MAQLSPLRRRMIEDMTVRNLSPATQRSYLNAVSKFSRYFGRSADHLGLEDAHAFQVHLVATGISWPALNQIVCALRFFYGVTLGHSTIPERIAYAREPRKLPVVLGADEVVSFLEAIPSLKSRIALTTVYATGLRVSEVVFLKVADIDSQRMVIRVEQGKGGRDRYWKTMTFLAALRHDRIDAPWFIEGPIDGVSFRTYVEKVLLPVLRPGDIVVLDNLASHRGKEVRQLIRAVGAKLFFLPKYSPDLNPIEQVFAKLKHLLRKAAARTVDAVCAAIGHALDAFTSEECANYLKNSGYRT